MPKLASGIKTLQMLTRVYILRRVTSLKSYHQKRSAYIFIYIYIHIWCLMVLHSYQQQTDVPRWWFCLPFVTKIISMQRLLKQSMWQKCAKVISQRRALSLHFHPRDNEQRIMYLYVCRQTQFNIKSSTMCRTIILQIFSVPRLWGTPGISSTTPLACDTTSYYSSLVTNWLVHVALWSFWSLFLISVCLSFSMSPCYR